MAVVTHWFNPAVNLAIKETALFCECSCDEEVVRGKDIHERRNYIRTIVRTANKDYKIPIRVCFRWSIIPGRGGQGIKWKISIRD